MKIARQERSGSVISVIAPQEGIGACPVVLAVGPDHAPVNAHVPRLERGHHLDLGADEVLFSDAVGIGEHLEDRLFDRLLFLPEEGHAAEKKDQFLALYRVRKTLLVLMLPGEVGKQIVNDEDRVRLVLADHDIDHRAVGLYHDPMEGEGHGHPLVFLYAPVIVGPEEGQIHVLVKGVLLEVEPGRIDMGCDNIEAVGEVFLPLNKGENLFVAMVEKSFLPGEVVGEAVLRKIPADKGGRLALGFRRIEKMFIIFAEFEYLFCLFP